MRHITTFAISAAALASVAIADVEASVTAGYHSRYIFRGIDFAAEGNELYDFGFDVGGSCDCGLDWFAGIWHGTTTNGSAYNETDIYAGVSKDLGFGTVELGVITYTYDQDFIDETTFNTGQLVRLENDSEIYLALSTSVGGLDLGSTTSFGTGGAWNSGIWQQFSLGYGVELNDKTSVALEVVTGLAFGSAGYSDGVDGFAHYQATLSVEHALSENIVLSPYVSYVTTEDDYTGGAPAGEDFTFEGAIVGASLSFTF